MCISREVPSACSAVVSFLPRIRATFRTFLGTFQLIGSKGKKILAVTMLLTAVQWSCRYTIISLLLAGLGIPAQPFLFMALQILVFALTILVPSPGGIGGAEVFFSLVYSSFLPAAALGMVTTLWRFFTFYLHSLLAALSVLILARISRDAETAAAGEVLPAFAIKEELRLVREVEPPAASRLVGTQ
jgi:uncharacterized protein (TIRG00374 family)